MHTLRFDPHGIHFAEMFADPALSDCLPGLLPEGDDPGDQWDETYEGIEHVQRPVR